MAAKRTQKTNPYSTPRGREAFAIRTYRALVAAGAPEKTAQRFKMLAYENPARFESELLQTAIPTKSSRSRITRVRARPAAPRARIRPAVRPRSRARRAA